MPRKIISGPANASGIFDPANPSGIFDFGSPVPRPDGVSGDSTGVRTPDRGAENALRKPDRSASSAQKARNANRAALKAQPAECRWRRQGLQAVQVVVRVKENPRRKTGVRGTRLEQEH